MKLLRDTLNEYRDCFAQSLEELGTSKTMRFSIQVTEGTPFTYRPYRMAKTEGEIVRKMIDELMRNKIIRESSSNYSSPILLVKKKNGEQRLCIDYRKLNSVMVKDNYPLPRIDDQLARLSEEKYFTSLDLKLGYYQIEVEEKS